MTQVKLTQTIDGNVTTHEIERYLICKRWRLNFGSYQSPCGAFELSLGMGEQLMLNQLSIIEKRCSNEIYLDIVEINN